MPASDPYSERIWRLAGMGATMASEIVAGALIGLALDEWVFDTGPVLLIVGTILGVLVGMGTFIRKALRETRQAARESSNIAARIGQRESAAGETPADTPDSTPNDTGPEP